MVQFHSSLQSRAFQGTGRFISKLLRREFTIWQRFLIVEIKATILRWGNSLWKSDVYVDKISNSTRLLLQLFTKHPGLVFPTFCPSAAHRVSVLFQQAACYTRRTNRPPSRLFWVTLCGADALGPWRLCQSPSLLCLPGPRRVHCTCTAGQMGDGCRLLNLISLPE